MTKRYCKKCGREFVPKCFNHKFCCLECRKSFRCEYMRVYMRRYRDLTGYSLGSLNFNDLHVIKFNGQLRVRSAVILEEQKK